MAKKSGRNTKQKIVSAAWKLFYEQGYDDTTVDDIVFESGTSKGSFYHYFESKDALLGSLNILFDEKYEELMKVIDPNMDAVDKLIYFNHELFEMIDSSVSIELITRMFSSQLITHGEKHLLDRKRTYFKLIKQIVKQGQDRGEVRDDVTVNQIVNDYAMFERALLYDWCLEEGEYSLVRNADRLMPMFLDGFRSSLKK
ncbi:TetR family transcriptional regulator [Oribacterium sp. C9]|uniref:TetR/AcrR family transcriptional regulator n=1 Tax=Oribacterium sp. C9 TaxID=1943579 RepID=UPI00098F8599|nr:TetR/AcrR family transcriptional regulator [Oribacterium sp. C9]OON87921.1 TetR family transcriptional regulator [Oribacterium sp. C9]